VCTVSTPANLKPHHDIQGTTVNWVGGEPRLACCMCNNYQQAINTRAALRFLLQPTVQSVCGHSPPHGQFLMKAIAVTGQIALFMGNVSLIDCMPLS